MNETNFDRVKSDLENIESAMGLRHPFDPQEVRVNLLFAGSGLAAALIALIPHGLSPLLGFVLFLVPIVEWLRLANRSPQVAPSTTRDVRAAIRTMWFAVPLFALFLWCRHQGLLPLQFLGLAVFVIGALLFSSAIGERYERTLLGWSAALMAGGLALPLNLAPPIAVLAITLACGGLLAAVLAFAAREDSSDHAAA